MPLDRPPMLPPVAERARHPMQGHRLLTLGLWMAMLLTTPGCSTLKRWLVPPGRGDDERAARTQQANQDDDTRGDPEVILVVASLPGEITSANALAIRRGRVMARGSLDDLQGLRGPATRVVQLPGGVAENGLVAAHVRVEQQLMAADAVDLHEARSVADVVAALQLAKPMVLSDAGWLWADRLDPAVAAKLTSVDLDRALGRVPVLVTAAGKPGALANAAMLVRLAELGVSLEELQGRLDERGLRLAWQKLPVAAPARLRPLLLALFSEAQKQGITEVQAFGGTAALVDALRMLDREGRLALRTRIFLDVERAEGRALLTPPPPRAEGAPPPGPPPRKPAREPQVVVAGVSLQLDGPVTTGTAALTEAYADLPRAGTLTYTDTQLEDLLHAADVAGVQVAVEAHGDAALAQLTGALARLGRPSGAPKLRVELPEVVSPTTLDALRDAGVQCTVQPILNPKDLDVLRKRLGTARTALVDRSRTLAEVCPIRVALDLTRPQPLRVLDRLTRHGDGSVDALDPAIAWQAMGTGGSADTTPRLLVGDPADLVVWSRDPRVPGKTPAQVMASVVGGTVTLLIGRDLD